MCDTTTTPQVKLHPFERAGLGKAPFRYAGMVDQDIRYGMATIGEVGGCLLQTTPGGTCDYCGMAILNMFRVQSADGKTFKVGCDCIEKVDAKLAKAIAPEIKRRKDAREKARIDAAKALLPNAESLRSKPHPTAFMATQGATLWDYAAFLMRNGGKCGQLRAARMIEKAINPA